MANKTNEAENKKIGRMMAYAREMKKVMQADLVESTGLSKNHISAVERGVSKASVEMLLGYCEKLGTTPNDILGYVSKEISPELISEIMKMNIEQQMKLLKIAKVLNE